MTYALSEEGRRALRSLTTRPILYAFDFDGTLAPISSNRDAVQISPSINELIKELVTRVPCAIVSGRALTDLASRLNGAIPYLVGNHGIESPTAMPASLCVAERVCLEWKKTIDTNFVQALMALGVEVEDKRYSLTLHYRGVAEPARVRMALLLLLQQLSPAPQIIFGKSSLNVLPPGQGGKGQAASALMVHLRQAGLFFIGDDETDEDVFKLTEGLAMGVRVGRHAESRAEYFINHYGEIRDILRVLIDQMDRTSKSLTQDDTDAVRAQERTQDL